MLEHSNEARRTFPADERGWHGCLMLSLLPEAMSTNCISGLVVEYIVAIDVTRARFPADAPRVTLVWLL